MSFLICLYVSVAAESMLVRVSAGGVLCCRVVCCELRCVGLMG